MVNLSIIREIAKDNNIKLKDIASELGMSEMGVQYIIKKNSTSLETLDKIAGILGVSVGVFFGETKAEGFELLRKIYENQDKINKLQAETNQLLIKLYNK